MALLSSNNHEGGFKLSSCLSISLASSLVVTAACLGDDILGQNAGILKALCILIGSGMGYLSIAIITGWFSSSGKMAAGLSSLSIGLSLVLYYLGIILFQLRPGVDIADLLKLGIVWLGIGLGCACIVAPASYLAHHGTKLQRSLTIGFSMGLILGPVVLFFKTMTYSFFNLDFSLQFPIVLTAILPCICLILAFKFTKPTWLLSSCLGGILASAALYFVVYQLFY